MTRQLLTDSFRVKLQLNESNEGGPLRVRGQFGKADVPTANGRIYPRHLWEREIKKFHERLKDSKSNGLGECDHPCLLDDDFKVLTTDGWKHFRDIKPGDIVWSRKDGIAVQSVVTEIVDEPYSGKAYHVKGRQIDCAFTPAHKFVLDKRPEYKSNKQIEVMLQDIVNNPGSYSHSAIPKTMKFEDDSLSYFVLPGVSGTNPNKTKTDYSQDLKFDSKVFAAFLGIYLSEGYCSTEDTDNFGVYIAQTNDWSRKYIQQEILEKLPEGMEYSEHKKGFYINDARLYAYLKKLGNQYDRYIPREIFSLESDALRELVFWFCIGDGRMVSTRRQKEEGKTLKECVCREARQGLDVKNVRIDVFTVSKRLIEDLHECVLRTGRSGAVTVVYPEKDYEFAGHIIKAENKVPLYNLNISKSKGIYLDPRMIEYNEIQHDGNIYCLKTEHGSFFMQKDGKSFWTGNSDGKTKLQRVSHIVTDLVLHEDGTIEGELEILDETERGKICAAIIKRCGEIGVSSRGLGSIKKNQEGYDVVQEDFGFMTFDCVADPAVSGSFPKVQYESTELEGNSLSEDTKVKHRVYKKGGKFLLCIENKYCGMFNKEEEINQIVESKEKVDELLSKYKLEAQDTASTYGSRAQTLKTMKQQADNLAKTNPTDAEKVKQDTEELGKDWGIDPEKVEVKEADGEEPSDMPPEDPGVQADEEPEEPKDDSLEADVYIVPDKEDVDEVQDILLRKGFEVSDVQERNQGVQFFFDPISETENYDEAKESILALDLVAVMEPDSAYVTKRSGRKLKINIDDQPKDDQDSGDDMTDKPKANQESVSESLRQEAYAKAVEAVEPVLRDKLVIEFEEAYQAKLQDVLSENRQLHEQVEALGTVSKELGFNLFLERNLKTHPDFRNIKTRLGNFQRLESLDDLKDTVKFKLEEAKEFERTRVVNERKKTAMLESKIMKLEDKLSSLEEENKTLQADLIESKNELQVKENRLFLESKLQGHPRAGEIRKIYESTGFMDQKGISTLVESYRPVISKQEKTLFESVQNAVKRRLPENLVENCMAGTRLVDAKPTEGSEKIYGVDFSEVMRLSGVEK